MECTFNQVGSGLSRNKIMFSLHSQRFLGPSRVYDDQGRLLDSAPYEERHLVAHINLPQLYSLVLLQL